MSKSETSDKHPNMTIGVGDLSPDEGAKVIFIKNDGVVLGFGPNYTNNSKVSFADCEVLWGV